jgi:hypothetical protein
MQFDKSGIGKFLARELHVFTGKYFQLFGLGFTKVFLKCGASLKPRSQPAILASAYCLLAKTWAKFKDPYVMSTTFLRIWEHADTL